MSILYYICGASPKDMEKLKAAEQRDWDKRTGKTANGTFDYSVPNDDWHDLPVVPDPTREPGEYIIENGKTRRLFKLNIGGDLGITSSIK